MKMETFEERMRRSEIRRCLTWVWHLEMKCLYLEQDWSRLRWKWPGRTPEEQRQLRRTKGRIECDVMALRIEFDGLMRRVKPLIAAEPG